MTYEYIRGVDGPTLAERLPLPVPGSSVWTWSSPGWHEARGPRPNNCFELRRLGVGTLLVSRLCRLQLYHRGNLKVLEFWYSRVVLEKVDKWNRSLICNFASLAYSASRSKFRWWSLLSFLLGAHNAVVEGKCCTPTHSNSLLSCWGHLASNAPSCSMWQGTFLISLLPKGSIILSYISFKWILCPCWRDVFHLQSVHHRLHSAFQPSNPSTLLQCHWVTTYFFSIVTFDIQLSDVPQ